MSQVDSQFGMIRVKKADLLAVAHYLIGHLSYSQVPALAKRHKVEAKKDSASAQELLVKKVGACDEAELCKLLLENQPAGFGVSAIHRQPRRRSHGRRQTLSSGCGQAPRSSCQGIRRETRQENNQAEDPQDCGLSPSICDFWRSADSHSAFS